MGRSSHKSDPVTAAATPSRLTNQTIGLNFVGIPLSLLSHLSQCKAVEPHRRVPVTPLPLILSTAKQPFFSASPLGGRTKTGVLSADSPSANAFTLPPPGKKTDPAKPRREKRKSSWKRSL